MPINPVYQAPFEFGGIYHVFNRCVDGQQLFYERENYRFFLEKYDKYLREVIRLYAWSLIPNHFHFFLSVREEGVIQGSLLEDLSIHDLVTRRFKNFFISYSKSLKKATGYKDECVFPEIQA